ncbi:tape measure protein, partial [Lactobacillus acetotolerans]|uniref:tape measure protein n=1 Tax=Lactobacillus acetotolerans TaxID=1600 RepID=UPI002FDA57B0
MAARKSYIEIGWRIDRSGLDEANRLTDGLTRAERSHREAVSQTTHNIDTQRHTISEVKSQTDTVAQAQERISSQAKRAATNTAEIGTAARSANGGVRGIDDSLGSAEKHSLRIRDIFKGTLIASAAYSGINMLGNGLKSLYQEANENAKAWQTFNGNLLMMGQSRKQIAATKADLQDFAVKTIYNASDMAQTYSQLSATGAKNTDKLVKGFAGLASSAQDPEQAMRSLSQQATQMAAMPKVQWQDLRIMMQQAPAGISAVARSMGESTGKMIQQVHAGKLSTQDFLAAIAKVGNDKNFQTMATHYKTADQALDGLRENLANQASPAFNRFNKIAVGALSDINNSLTGTAGKSFAKQMDPFYDGMEDFIKYMKQNGKYFFSIGGSLGSITKSLASGAWTALSGMINIIAGKGPGAGNSIKTIADSVKEIAKHKTEIQIIGGTLATFWAVKKASDFLGVVKQINGQLRISSRLSSVGNAMDDIHSYGKPAVTPTSKKVGSATYSYGGSYGNITKQIEQAGTTSGRHFAMEATKGGTKAGTTGGTKFASKVKTAGNSAGTSGGSRFAGKIQAAGRYAGSTGGGRFASRIRNSNWSKFGALVGASFGIEAFTGKTAKTRARGAGQGIGGFIAGALYGPEAAPIGAAVGGAIANTIIGLVDNWKPAQKGMKKNISKIEKRTGKSYNSNNQAWSNNGPSNLQGGLDGKASGGPITKTQLSAVNEAGTELAYNPSTGHFRTLGDGPAFTQLKAVERILKASDVSRMLHGGLGAGRTLPGYAAGTGSVTPATIGTTGIGSTKLNSTKDMSKSYSQETKKSTAALKKFNSDSKKTWKSTQSETSKVTRSISKRGVSDFDDMQKGVNTQMKQMNKQVGSGARDTAHDFGSAMGKLD